MAGTKDGTRKKATSKSSTTKRTKATTKKTTGSRSKSSGKKKPSSPARRKKKKAPQNRSWLIIGLCVGVVLVVLSLVYFFTENRIHVAQRIKVIDQVLLAQLYQLNISQEGIRRQEVPWDAKRSKGIPQYRWQVIVPQTLSAEKVLTRIKSGVQEVCPDVEVSYAKVDSDVWKVLLKIDDRRDPCLTQPILSNHQVLLLNV